MNLKQNVMIRWYFQVMMTQSKKGWGVYSIGPPCNERSGRPISELIDVYKLYSIVTWNSVTIDEQLSDSVSCTISKLSKLSLQEYCRTHKEYCSLYHNRSSCPECTNNMIKAVQIIFEAGICTISSVFRSIFPEVTYYTSYGKRQLLQMPVVAVCIQEPSSSIKYMLWDWSVVLITWNWTIF